MEDLHQSGGPSFPIFLGSGSARSALVSEGSVVKGNLLRSVVGLQTFIDDDAEVVESVIGPRSYVGKGAKLYRSDYWRICLHRRGRCYWRRRRSAKRSSSPDLHRWNNSNWQERQYCKRQSFGKTSSSSGRRCGQWSLWQRGIHLPAMKTAAHN